MMGRRTAAMLCVLLGHALVVFMLMLALKPRLERAPPFDAFFTELIDIPADTTEQARLPVPETATTLSPPQLPDFEGDISETPAAGESAGISQPGYTDWPREGRDAAARVLAREAEAERVARLFAGPQGTWASLTKRQQSELNHFRWKPGVDGLERDKNGNTIYRMPNGCTLVNFMFIGCPLGKKPPAYGDLFKDMRLYFDEQRLPETKEGNGREPESMRPPKWSKPLE
jgi:hypothetical protein